MMAAATITDRTFINVCAKGKKKQVIKLIEEKYTATSNIKIAS